MSIITVSFLKVPFNEGKQLRVLLSIFFIALGSACSPRVEIAAPEKPIEINLNVKIEHEVRIKVQKDLEEEVFSDESELF